MVNSFSCPAVRDQRQRTFTRSIDAFEQPYNPAACGGIVLPLADGRKIRKFPGEPRKNSFTRKGTKMDAFIRTLWSGFWNHVGPYRTGLYSFVKTRRQRNDEEIELNNRLANPLFLEKFGFKVYSQNDEDGIIEEIFNRIGEASRTFVEFGVENGLECNSHYLLHKGWKGVWIEGSQRAVKEIQALFKKPLQNGRLVVVNGFIKKSNIDELIEMGMKAGGEEGKNPMDIDLLSIDIDGNDYWVWQEIKCVNPRVVVIEYNAKFPPNFEWIMEYNDNHVWQGDDEQGASLKALELLGRDLGYQLVGTNMGGSNAFFVRMDLAGELFFTPPTSEKLYNPTRWMMQYVSGHYSKKYIGT
jgi:hypothetical protein